MSRFTLFGFFVLLCVIQVLADKKEEQAPAKEDKQKDEIAPFLRKAQKDIIAAEKAKKKYRPPSSAMRTLRRQTHVTRHPCTCNPQTESCSCCGRVDQASTNFQARGCGTVRYGRRRNRSLRYEVSVNNRTTARTEATGRDPDLMCHPFPRYPWVDVCWQFHSTSYDDSGKLHFCLTVDGRFSGYVFYQSQFECVDYDTTNPQAQVVGGGNGNSRKSKSQ